MRKTQARSAVASLHKKKTQALAVASLPVVLVIATTHAVGLSDLRFETRLNTPQKKKRIILFLF